MTPDPRSVRRGLPRTPGGDPWPPARALPVEEADAVVSEPEDVEELPVEVTAVTVGVPAATRPARAVRRGLPRESGGEPWPPAVSAPAAGETVDASTPALGEPEAVPVPTPAPVDEAAAPRAPRRGLPRPGGAAAPAKAPAPPAAVAQSPAEAEPVPAAAAVTAAPPVPRAPLPFTRTVWAGAAASAPRERKPEPQRIGPFTRVQWLGAVIIGGGGLLFAAAMAVALVRWLLSLDALQDWLVTYPGEYHLPEGAPVGFPAWLNWAHFLNTFFILLIIRSGLQVRREKRPTAFWTPKWNNRRKISLALWFHQALDILWMLNGLVFVVLLLASGQWMRIVPTSWEVFPNAVSAALQYVSLDWPTENGWVNYNALQQLAYFATTFVAAPLAIVTGVRMSGVWPKNAQTLNRLYPVEWARRVHFPVMLYFVAFIIVHVALVFATGALRNLNHMYAAQGSTDPNAYADNWLGFAIFALSMLVLAAGWVAARPLVLAPIAGLFGTVKGR